MVMQQFGPVPGGPGFEQFVQQRAQAVAIDRARQQAQAQQQLIAQQQAGFFGPTAGPAPTPPPQPTPPPEALQLLQAAQAGGFGLPPPTGPRGITPERARKQQLLGAEVGAQAPALQPTIQQAIERQTGILEQQRPESPGFLTGLLGTLGQATNIAAGVIRDPIGVLAEPEVGITAGGSFQEALQAAEELGGAPTPIQGFIPGIGQVDVGRFLAQAAGDPLNLVPGLGFGRQIARGARAGVQAALPGPGAFVPTPGPALEQVTGGARRLAGAQAGEVPLGPAQRLAADQAGLIRPGAGLEEALQRVQMIRRVPAAAARGVRGAIDPRIQLQSPDVVDRLAGAVQELDLPGLRRAFRAQRRESLGERIMAAGPFIADPTEAGRIRALQELQGQLTDDEFRRFTAIGDQFSEQEILGLNRRIITELQGDAFAQLNARNGLNKILALGELPSKTELRALRRAFGPQVVRQLQDTQRSLGARGLHFALNLIGVPRTLKTSYDISLPFRQGLPFITRPEFRGLWGPMLRSLRSDEIAQRFDNIARAVPDDISPAAISGRRDLAFRDLPGVRGEKLSRREEGFQSELAEVIPGVKASGRAFTVAGNFAVGGYYDNTARLLDRFGDVIPNDYRRLAQWSNIVVGRGGLPGPIEGTDLPAFLSNTLFAPRFLSSRLQILTAPLDPRRTPLGILRPGRVPLPGGRSINLGGRAADRRLRREIARDVVGYYAAIAGFLGLAGIAAKSGILPDTDITLDPRSSDFCKAKILGIRVDPGGGICQMITFMGRLATGERVKLGTGEVLEADPVDTFGRFARSKLSPVAALAVNIQTGETIVGEAVTPELIASDLFVPISLDDIAEAAKEEGIFAAIAVAPLALTGFGIQSFTTFGETQQEVGQELFGQNFRDLNAEQKRQVNDDPRIVTAREELPNNQGPLRTRISNAFETRRAFNANLEDDLARRLQATQDSRERADLIRDFKRDRFVGTEAVFSDPEIMAELESRGSEEDQPIEDIFGQRYWSVELEENPVDGTFDFNKQREQRGVILQEAIEDIGRDPAAQRRLESLGISPEEFIIGGGESTFRGKRFANPLVREAIEEFEGVTAQLEESGFFALQDDLWQPFGEAAPDRWEIFQLDRFDSFSEWASVAREALVQLFTDQGLTAGQAQIAAGIRLSLSEVVQAWNRGIRSLRVSFESRNPDISDLAREWGFLRTLPTTPTTEQQALLVNGAVSGQ